MKRQNVKIILVEPYFDLKTPQSIGRETGAKVLVMPPSVGGEKEITDYFALFDYDLEPARGRDQGNGSEVACGPRDSASFWRRRSWPA